MRKISIDFQDEGNNYLNCCIDGGISGENLATILNIVLPEYVPDNAVCRLIFNPGGQTEILEPKNRILNYEIPKSLSLCKAVKMGLEAYDGEQRVFKAPTVTIYFKEAFGEMPAIKADDPIRREVTANIANIKKLQNEKLNKDELPNAVDAALNKAKQSGMFDGKDGLQGPIGPKGDKGETGEKGDKGEKGERGERGYRGEDGINGNNGINGLDGRDGVNGKSAYEIAVESGYIGTEEEFNANLKRKVPKKVSELENDSNFLTKYIIADDKISNQIWTSKNTVEKICGVVNMNAPIVNFVTLQDYPVCVTTEISFNEDGYTSISLTRCGKNILNLKGNVKSNYGVTISENADGTFIFNGTPTMDYINFASIVNFPPCIGEYVLSSINNSPIYGDGIYAQVCIDRANGKREYMYSGSRSIVISRRSDDKQHKLAVQNYEKRITPTFNNYINGYQLEVGNRETAYECYKGDTYSVNFPKKIYKGRYNWTTGELVGYTDKECKLTYSTRLAPTEILAFEGINNIFSNAGRCDVKYVNSPKHIFNKVLVQQHEIDELKNAILSMGGKV